MIFGVGPVLRYEMITTARRGRYYLARVVYGLILLYVLWDQQRSWEWFHAMNREFFWTTGGTMGGSHEEIRRFAESAFIQFAGVQGLVLLCLIPALLAGVIADEYQRKTLHYLLASRLSSAEIVLGKLAARLVHVGAIVALGLPVVSLLALYGGLNPEYVLFSYLGTATTVFCTAGLSMLISILAERPRDAILTSYGLLALWLLGPISIAGVAHEIRGPLFWIGTVNDWLLISNPMVVWGELTRGSFRFTTVPATLGGRFLWNFSAMAAIHTILGLLSLVLAIAGLRPLRGSVWPGGKPHTGWGSRLAGVARSISRSQLTAPVLQNQILAARRDRPPCGERPMLWKERYTTPSGGLRWLSSPLILIFCSVALGCYLLDVTQPTVAELVRGSPTNRERTEVNAAVRQSSVVLGILAMLTVAASASVSLTGEREGDTWVSLATTLLTPIEIIGGKQFGALWSARRIGVAILIVWIIGLLLGAIDLLGFLAALVITLCGAWFIASMGVLISSRATNGTRALVATFVIMFVTGWIWPRLLWGSLVSGQDLATLRFELGSGQRVAANATLEALIGFAIMPAVYTGAAGVLTLWLTVRLRTRWGGN